MLRMLGTFVHYTTGGWMLDVMDLAELAVSHSMKHFNETFQKHIFRRCQPFYGVISGDNDINGRMITVTFWYCSIDSNHRII